uniref:Uncharacterized protein n=1 Tax=Rhizophora mucronata TaxID=61149 RepID=A0A2P2IU11_RHIMU
MHSLYLYKENTVQMEDIYDDI